MGPAAKAANVDRAQTGLFVILKADRDESDYTFTSSTEHCTHRPGLAKAVAILVAGET